MVNHDPISKKRKPEIGLWWAACCVLDLQQIQSGDDLAEAMNGWDYGGYAGAWPSREEAIAALHIAQEVVRQSATMIA